MSPEQPKPEETKETVVIPDQPKLSAEDLQARMAELQEQIKEAQRQKGVEQEKSTTEKIEELGKIWTEGTNIEAEKEKLATKIEQAQQELQRFEQMMQSVKELGIDVEQDQKFMEAFQAAKDKPVTLEQQQAELMNKARDIASNPDVMARVQEEAGEEKIEKDKQEKKKLSSELIQLYRQKEELVAWMDNIKLNLPYAYWRNRAREIPSKEFIQDPANAKILEPLMKAEGDFKILLNRISEIEQRLDKLQTP